MKNESKYGRLFRELDDDEKFKFRLWARENYVPGSPIDELWHPVVREACEAINAVASRLPLKSERDDWEANTQADRIEAARERERNDERFGDPA